MVVRRTVTYNAERAELDRSVALQPSAFITSTHRAATLHGVPNVVNVAGVNEPSFASLGRYKHCCRQSASFLI